MGIGQPYARVDFTSQSGTLDLFSGFFSEMFNLDVNSFSLIHQSLRFHGVTDNGDHKGTVSRDFLLQVFFMNQFPPYPRVFHLDRFEFFRKFAEIFASQGAPPVSATPAANFYTIFASVVDTGGK
jgi:hypothetical protein